MSDLRKTNGGFLNRSLPICPILNLHNSSHATFRQMFLQFIPLSVGEKNAALTIRISGFKNDRGKSVKSTVKLKGTGEAEFHAMAVEETMSETLMNITNLDQTRARF